MKKRPTIYLEIFNSTSGLRKILSAPFIYWMIVPLIFLDLSLEIYHQISFRLYKLPIVRRSDYIFIDRHKLSELTFMQKVNCVYCGYANGLMAYGVKIAGETEKYWCSIKHQDPKSLQAQPHHSKFYERTDFEKN